jgi:DMSO/TMAO reductase YedYZ molybdopterin-dependent catalytic subunit
MTHTARPVPRRQFLAGGGTLLAVLSIFDSPLFAWGRKGETTLPFLDQPPKAPLEGLTQLDWQNVDSWITPNERFFAIGHYGVPEIDAKAWKLEIDGLVDRPRAYTLDELRGLGRKEVVFTLECSGNSGFDWFQGGIGNARWAGVPLAEVLQAAGLKKDGIEVVFYGADGGDETVPYIGGLGDKMGDIAMKTSFARSMSVAEATDPANLLCYEMNGAPLPNANGFPLRLIAPGWYGIANVKWLTRIEVRATRYLGTFMATRYVTLREEPRPGGGSVWTRNEVGRSRLKSIPAKVTIKDGQHRIYGAAWGAPVARVEVRIDDGAWTPATLGEGREHDFAWKFWHLDWPRPAAGEHRIASRAVGASGEVQPAPDDWSIARKKTYWEANGQITRTIRI